MSPDDTGRLRYLRALFDAVMDQPPGTRGEFVARVTQDDPALRRELADLVASAGPEPDLPPPPADRTA